MTGGGSQNRSHELVQPTGQKLTLTEQDQERRYELTQTRTDEEKNNSALKKPQNPKLSRPHKKKGKSEKNGGGGSRQTPGGGRG